MRSEDRAQAEIFELLGWLAPSIEAYACPNSSCRTTSGKPTNAVPGLRKGVWDIQMILPLDCLYPGRTAYCEVKVPPNDLSTEQRRFRMILVERQVPHFIARAPLHLDQTRAALALWKVKTKEASRT